MSVFNYVKSREMRQIFPGTILRTGEEQKPKTGSFVVRTRSVDSSQPEQIGCVALVKKMLANLMLSKQERLSGVTPTKLAHVLGVTVALGITGSALAADGDGFAFRDVTAQSGIDFEHTNGRAGELFVIEVKGSGVAFIDFDNDGDLDLYAVNGNNLPGAETDIDPINRLYRNEGDGSFIDVTEESGAGDGSYGHGVTVADYDNDGDQDMYIANYGPNVLYRNNGDGTFTDVTVEAGVGGDVWSASSAFCDLDNDGLLDLYVANYLVFDINSTVRLPTGPAFYDGEVDVLYLNNGDGTFRDVTAESIGNPNGKGLGVVCFDYDDDGDLELYVANDGVENLMYENNGDGTFTDVTLFSGTGVNGAGESEAGMGVDAADYDNDGDFDLFVTNYKGESNTLMRNDGGGMFTDATSRANLMAPSLPYVTFGTGFFDPDNDGDLDVFVANGHTEEDEADHEQPDQVFENVGNGRFEDVSEKSGTPFQRRFVGRGAAFGDFDNDGDIDIVVSNKNGPLNLLQNQGGPGQRNWLLIRTVGTDSNRDGIGAKIEISAPGFERIKEVKTSYSMFSSNDPRTHFGLGDIDRVSVTVRWPSGIVDTLEDIPSNRLLTIVEGSGDARVTDLQAIDANYADGAADDIEIAVAAIDPAAVAADMERLRGMLTTGSEDAAQYLLLAPSLLAWMDQRTEQRFAELLAEEPDNLGYLAEYGDYMFLKRQFAEAIATYQRATALQPDNAAFYKTLTTLQARAGRFEEAAVSARRALELGDSSVGVYMRLGESLIELQRVDEAEEVIKELLDRYPNDVGAWLRLGRMYADGDRLEDALRAFQKAVSLDSGAREIRYQLAEVNRRLGDNDEYERQMALFGVLETESALFKGGMTSDHEIELIRREIRMNPLFGRTRADRELALRYGELGDVANQELYSVRGRLSTVKDRLQTAIDTLDRLRRIDGSPATARLFEELDGLRDELVSAFNRATGYDAAGAEESVAAAEGALADGDLGDALAAFRAALLANPDNAAAFRGLARVYARGGLGNDQAIQYAQKAAMIDQSDDSHELLAELGGGTR